MGRPKGRLNNKTIIKRRDENVKKLRKKGDIKGANRLASIDPLKHLYK
jgi:hypothetical protein